MPTGETLALPEGAITFPCPEHVVRAPFKALERLCRSVGKSMVGPVLWQSELWLQPYASIDPSRT